MAKVESSDSSELNFTANLNIADAKKNAAELAKVYQDLKIQAYDALVLELRNFGDQANTLAANYAQDKQDIQSNADKNGLADTEANLKKRAELYEADKNKLVEAITVTSDVSKKAGDDVIKYSKDQLQAQIDAVKFALDNSSQLSAEVKAALNKMSAEAQQHLDDDTSSADYLSNLKKKRDSLEKSIAALSKPADNKSAPVRDKEDLPDDGKKDADAEKTITDQYKAQVTLLADINVKIKTATVARFDTAAKDLTAIGSAFDSLSKTVGTSNAGLADTLSAIGEIAKVGASAAGAVSSFMTGDVVGGVSKGIAAITGVISFLSRGKASAKAADIELKGHQDSLLKGEITYNELLRARARTLKDIGSLSIAELNTQKALLDNQTVQAQADYNTLLGKIQGSGQQITGYHVEKSGGIFGIGKKSTTVTDKAGLGGADYATLEKLFTEGKLDDATKAWFTELQKSKSEMDAIKGSTNDVLAAINQVATGTTASSIADAIISGFKQGKRTAESFADDFKGLMEDAALSAFKANYLNDAIAGFYKQFAAASADGLSADDVETLRSAYSKIIQEGVDNLDGFDKIIGNTEAPKALAAPIQGNITAAGLTEDTGNELKGIFRGTYDLTKAGVKTMGDIYQMSVQQFSSTLEIAANTKRGADNTDGIGDKLDKIIINTTTTNAGDPFRNAGIKLG